MSFLVNYFSDKESKFIEVAPREECRDMHHLETFFQDMIDKGGEGVILRDPSSLLQPGRSPGYLKHKVRPQLFSVFLFLMTKLIRNSEMQKLG